MEPYLITFFILTLASLTQFTRQLKKYKLFFVLFAAIYLIFFAGLRTVGVGKDDQNYYDMFVTQVPNLYEWAFGCFVYHFKELHVEPGYVFVNAIVRTFTENYIFLFLTAAFISVSISVYNYYRYSKYALLSILLYFVHTYLYRDMNQLRAGIAAAIGLFLIAQIHNREHIKVYRTLFFTGIFHIASLSLLLPYMLSFFKVTRKKILLLYVVSLGLGIMGVAKAIVMLLPNSGFIFMKISDYASDQLYGAPLGIFDVTNLKNSLILLVVLVYWDRLKVTVPYFETFALFLAISASWRIAFSDIGILAGRVATFFDIVEVIIIPYFICIFRYKWMTVSAIILYAFVTLYLNLYTVKISPQPYTLSLF
jgi:hypothetical protein